MAGGTDMDTPVVNAALKQPHPIYVSNLPYNYTSSQLQDLIRGQVELEPVSFPIRLSYIA